MPVSKSDVTHSGDATSNLSYLEVEVEVPVHGHVHGMQPRSGLWAIYSCGAGAKGVPLPTGVGR